MICRIGLFVILLLTAIGLIACGGGQQSGANLTGTNWALTSLGGEAPLPDTTITLTFGQDGTVNGSTGCNSFSTAYETEGNKISISEQASMTMMACPDPVMAQEQGFMFAAKMAKTFEINGEELVFKDANGKTLATFKAQ